MKFDQIKPCKNKKSLKKLQIDPDFFLSKGFYIYFLRKFTPGVLETSTCEKSVAHFFRDSILTICVLTYKRSES